MFKRIGTTSTALRAKTWFRVLVLAGGAVAAAALGAGFENIRSKNAATRAERKAKADSMMANAAELGIRVDCARGEMEFPAPLWQALSTNKKRGAVIAAATHCDVGRLTVRDEATSRTIARFSGGRVDFD